MMNPGIMAQGMPHAMMGPTQMKNIMAKIFKALSDETRVKIALALCQEDELCVSDRPFIQVGAEFLKGSPPSKTKDPSRLAGIFVISDVQ
ncbi:hypothetical protein DFP98_11344 [Cohnella phaseoli]|uniref:Transcriptional regulator n=1 Tax=Cohnella phaseoli TaxID=456490 RepID=A0A3D9JPN3_9BACL|nr:hypothetical protein DFP98_11344 [Cohnella phaseoli]